MKQIIVKVDGMKCGMCEAHINDLVRKIDGVKKVTSSHKKGLVTVLLEDILLVENINNAIKNQGYRVISYEINEYKKKGLFLK